LRVTVLRKPAVLQDDPNRSMLIAYHTTLSTAIRLQLSHNGFLQRQRSLDLLASAAAVLLQVYFGSARVQPGSSIWQQTQQLAQQVRPHTTCLPTELTRSC
jgi:uncharacterized membrane protein